MGGLGFSRKVFMEIFIDQGLLMSRALAFHCIKCLEEASGRMSLAR
ncbi:MAG: hypothetical protein QXO22_01845 [Thermosphaera sp.]